MAIELTRNMALALQEHHAVGHSVEYWNACYGPENVAALHDAGLIRRGNASTEWGGYLYVTEVGGKLALYLDKEAGYEAYAARSWNGGNRMSNERWAVIRAGALALLEDLT